MKSFLGKVSSLANVTLLLLLMLVAAASPLLLGFSFSLIPAAATTTTTPIGTMTEAEQNVLETQDTSSQMLTEEHRDVNGLEFTPRWGAVATIAPDSVNILFADCLPGEFAVSSIFIFESTDVVVSQSFPTALPNNDIVTWIAVVQNTGNNNARAASIGVICVGENQGVDRADVDVDIRTKTTIDNTVKNFIQIQNNQIINLNNIVNIRQTLVQNAIQILSITGNNNVVNQVIQQSAAQIINQGATTGAPPAPTDIQQIIDQNAQQTGVISGGTSLSQLIQQGAQQQANVTTGGFGQQQGGTTVDQQIDQGAQQGANVTTGGGPTTLDQIIGQRADQQAEVQQEAEAAEEQAEAAEEQAEAAEEQAEAAEEAGAAPTTPGGPEVEQEIQQEAEQEAEVQQEEEQQPEGGAANESVGGE